MNKLNLTEWALHHKQLVYYFVFMTFIIGIFSYFQLGRMEDPDFVLRKMIVSVSWPGASARQVEDQVTDKIEKKLQDLPGLDYLNSYSKPGQAVIYVALKDTVAEKDIRPTWMDVRNMVNDIKGTLPQGIVGPTFNDRFDDVFGCIYALTSDGFTYEEMRSQAEKIRRILLGVSNVKKVELLGVQDEKIYIEIENNKLAQLGIDPNLIVNTIKAQDAMAASGMIDTFSDNVYLRVSGMFDNIDSIRNLPIRANDRTFRLGDIAKIERSYSDPIDPKMYYNGQPAIGIAVSMDKGGNILTLGADLTKTVTQIKKNLPLGFDLDQIANQPQSVEESIGEFVKSLREAIIIVLLVSFLSLGMRSGMVVALCIPLVLAGTFTCMKLLGIDLHKISLGALIIALGLLVDDAIIAVEMMSVKLEQGWDRFKAACFAYTATAFPMLTGTLITCAGFIPIGFSKGNAGEYVCSIFTVVTIALLISWLISVLVTPLLGYILIKPKSATKNQDIYDSKFYQFFRKILLWCLGHRKLVLSITLASFIGSIFLFKFIKQEFFPSSLHPELIVEMRLPEGASLQATEQEAKRFAETLADDPNISHYSYYVGEGAPRFVLTTDPTLPASNYAQFVIVAKNVEARNALNAKVDNLFAKSFANVRGHTKVILTGPPSPYPVMLRVTGYDHEKVREIASQVSNAMASNPHITHINWDWNEKSKVMHLTVDQNKARMLGIDSQTLASNLQSQLSGAALSEFREQDKTVDIVFRIDQENRKDLSHIKDLNIHIGNGQFVPLDQIAQISYEAEDGLIWRRDLKPTITVQADTVQDTTSNDATKQVYDSLKDLRENLPPGYSIDIGGSLERSKQSMQFLLQPVPAMFIIILTLLMFQLQKISLMFLTVLTAPLGIIGISISMILTQRPMGFVAELGVLALSGMIIRNSVILIDQIEQHIKAGESPWDAIIDSTILRFRPIMLTAAAAILGMIPLMASTFWGPMAVAIAGGLFCATILTLLVLPTMYATWFKVTPNSQPEQKTTAM
ncbi:efflux RND transporter permease subunit [Sporomusa acidovorans]|uniref:Efflux pump membrane transporter BepE n=1 Tax=Sporomusa acidovorans (strain ATCC 49682 / DSM 3132 / Mol) TaxID=1123286 RepID=A0ABZ3IYJ2_SPOA4|nr:efflux RND transporter permease subunit [Sporomusa acidovorans]OZC16955.1 efflux pump membrane transporter BepE [Sporomusa acidovorans DSM 3132]SDE13670.1 Multidrug efflux pump subunit AcrB [Sporomusa acidovorans]